MKSILIAVTLLASGLLLGEERTWTSADGSKTFEGTLRSYDPGTRVVSVVTGDGRLLSFTTDKLSAEDVSFLEEWTPPASPGSSAAAGPDTESEVGMRVAKAKLQRLDGERYRRAELEKTPEFYLFYYSASW